MISRGSLRYDASADRSYARLRAGVALVMLPAAVILVMRGGLLGKLLGVLGTALGILWLRRAARAPKPPEFERIDIGDESFVLHAGTLLREIRFTSIERIEADESSLAVHLTLRGGETVSLPPGYGGLGVSALAERLREAAERADA